MVMTANYIKIVMVIQILPINMTSLNNHLAIQTINHFIKKKIINPIKEICNHPKLLPPKKV